MHASLMTQPILITGGGGMLARDLARRLPHLPLRPMPRAELDLGDSATIERALERHQPATVINCAAMTAVDACESRSDDAFRANAVGAGAIAMACHRHGVRLLHVSTDYVFPGDLDRPYHEWDAPGPRTIYGASKLAGEQAVRMHCPDHLIVRVAWLYGPGGPSFLHTMLKLGAQDGPALSVVDDQVGNPTSTTAVADHLALLLDGGIAGTVHLSCEGETTWCGFARAIFARAGLQRAITPCTTAQYPRPAPRPANSRLDKRALRLHALPPMPRWEDALDRFLLEHPHG